MAMAPERMGIGIRRHFTTDGVHPYDQVSWERRDARITSYLDGSVTFEQRGVEVPATWSVNATNILAQKYFRGALGSPEREWSLRQVADRVADTITNWGVSYGYFVDEAEAEAFNAELKYLIVNQRASFNSPVWFNIGVPGRVAQSSACQPYHALVPTPEGLVPIGRLVEAGAIGAKVLDAHGVTKVVAVKANGRKPVLRIRTKSGHTLDVTADHLVWRADRSGLGRFVPAGELEPGDRLSWHRTESWGDGEISSREIAEAALAGWLQSDGFVGQCAHGTNRSLTIEAMTVTESERRWVLDAIDHVFPGVHRHERRVVTRDQALDCRRTRLHGAPLEDFVDRWGLRARGVDMEVPPSLNTAPLPVVAAYLRSVFQAEGYVRMNATSAFVGLDMISEAVIRGVQSLLSRFGIFSRVRFKRDRRADRKGCWSLAIGPVADRRRFADEIGFVDERKASKLEATLRLSGRAEHESKGLTIDSIDPLGEMEVYDIQTESGEYLSGNLRVHNCFILSVEDSMASILNWYVEEGIIFKGGSGSGVNLSKIRSSKEPLRGGGTASGPVSFMRGADASAGTIKSGGTTRRAAKMVILNADHPDIEDFIWCKAIEERKARALRDAGFDMDLDGKDSHSVQYQNANNSVRLTDEFMQAVVDDRDWHLRAVTTGETVRTVKARDLFRQIAKAAWECADPGVQYDTTINRWHTLHNHGRITASNPCFPGDALVHTDKGLVRFDALLRRVQEGETFGVYTHDATNASAPSDRVEVTTPEAFMVTGFNEIVRLEFDNGMELRCTPTHKLFTANRGYVAASDLTAEDAVRVLDVRAPAVAADRRFPVSVDQADYRRKADQASVRLPEKWNEEFAHYLGWLVGDGCISSTGVASAIYGSAEDREHVLPSHLALLTEMCEGHGPKPSEQPNGTQQLRLGRCRAVRFLQALGLRPVKAPDKTVPWAVEQAPPDIVAAFLRGLYDADGSVCDLVKSRFVSLGSSSRALLQGTQRLLATLGVFSRIYTTNDREDETQPFTHLRKDGTFMIYESSPMYDLRISGQDIVAFAEQVGFTLPSKQAKLERLIAEHGFDRTKRVAHLARRHDDGVELTYNLSEPRNHSYIVNGVVVRNCSEYLSVDNSACNLASVNLLRYLNDDGTFDVEGFKASVEVMFTAQEILVGMSDYPTEKIAENTRRFRQLGLGYANLGALLMAQGMPYDSDEGRAHAGAITALMTGHAYATSARTAARMGPFAGYTDNAEHMLRVLSMHRDEVAKIDEELVEPDLLSAAQESWDDAVELAGRHGVRNSQATVLAPTGTISFLLDCDTTGIEPDLGLVKMKKLVGGGTMSIVNQTVPRALRRLGYSDAQVADIVAYIDQHKSIIGAPHLAAEHLRVFACSMGDLTIHHSGHIRMMAAVQPFISGAISKCVVGETLLPTSDGLVRIGSLHRGESPDSFRHEVTELASLDGPQKTDAFYYGGRRPVRELTLRSGHRIAGTPNHRVLVAGDGGLQWRRLDEIEPGEHVVVQYGADMWSSLPARFDDFRPTKRYGSQHDVSVPAEMSQELSLLLGVYASEGCTSRSNWTIRITNSVDSVLELVVELWRSLFGLEATVVRDGGRCPHVVVASKTVVEFFEYLGCGTRASTKRIPDAVLRSPRPMVLAFLRGLALDAYVTTGSSPKWAICLDAPALLDDLQSVLTNLGVVHGRVAKANKVYDKTYDEVYVTGRHAQVMAQLVPFLEPEKAARADLLAELSFEDCRNTADVVPGIAPRELHALLPRGRRGEWIRARFGRLLDPRTKHVSRWGLEQVAAVPGVELPQWLGQVLADGLHFSPVARIADAGQREVFDVSVPATHAFVGNGIVNHNTVNVPEEATIEDIEQVHLDAWRLGLKAVAVYRDNCKVAQPLSTVKKDAPASEAEAHDQELAQKVAELEKALERQTVVVKQPIRERLPRRRKSSTFAFRVADCEGYCTVGEYEDGRPGEVFMKVSKQGSTLAGIMDAFSISVSLGLQHGVPLKTYVQKYTNMRFEPAGMTDDPDLRIASSLVDYIFRRLAVDYLDESDRFELGILTTGERIQPTLPGVEETITPNEPLVEPAPVAKPVVDVGRAAAPDAPYCMQCGVQMVRAGSCHACPSCGTTSGCS